MLSAGERRHYLGRKVEYLFSYDLHIKRDPEQLQTSRTIGGVSIHVVGNGQKSPVYHVLGDDMVLGNDGIAGEVDRLDQRLVVREQSNLGVLESKLTIVTTDGALIWSQHQGVVRLGPRGLPRLLGGSTKFQAKAFITPRFETAYPKYRWLAERQCIGYGLLNIENGALSSGTFDIYSATAPLP
jgi:hypothetical protein